MQDHFFIRRIRQVLSVVYEEKCNYGKNYIGENGKMLP